MYILSWSSKDISMDIALLPVRTVHKLTVYVHLLRGRYLRLLTACLHSAVAADHTMLMLVCMTILSCPVLLYSRAVSRSAGWRQTSLLCSRFYVLISGFDFLVVCSNSQTSLKELASTDSMANIASLSSVDEFHLENVASRRKGRAVTSHSNALWKEAIIPYKFHESVLAGILCCDAHQLVDQIN